MRGLMQRLRMSWAVSGQAMEGQPAGCLLGYLWVRLAYFGFLLALPLVCRVVLWVAWHSGDDEFIRETQRTVAQMTPLLFL